MGANLANEVADGQFCETTIGCRDLRVAPLLRDIIQTDDFRVVVVDDEDAVEVCGALKVFDDFSLFLKGVHVVKNERVYNSLKLRIGQELINVFVLFWPGEK